MLIDFRSHGKDGASPEDPKALSAKETRRHVTTGWTQRPHPQAPKSREEPEVNGLIGTYRRPKRRERRGGNGARSNDADRPENGQPSIVRRRGEGTTAHTNPRLGCTGDCNDGSRYEHRERRRILLLLRPKPGADRSWEGVDQVCGGHCAGIADGGVSLRGGAA